METPKDSPSAPNGKTKVATLGGGCFWCVEAVFERIRGVEAVISGYAGGRVENPTYDAVCTGATGHAEVCQIHFNPEEISFETLLEVFWLTHDPTTLNRQGNDVGTQYRSVIYYHDESQKETAEKSIAKAGGKFENKIVTELAPLPKFYEAEKYHQDYFAKNPDQPYCAVIIPPKLEKIRGMEFFKP
ncbi:MAG: peptide-methionine (S)-S-oxide reductase [Opitutae bacterium]|nr:peptide-methionine (S)-S-oxide reductase [Rhodospirillaceae bacterium]MBL61862.1 peptide-methionine (S)-S-oxide reductase [Opitutae bacterium]